jgi:hypothetical protein
VGALLPRYSFSFLRVVLVLMFAATGVGVACAQNPSVDAILKHYVTALGGERAIESVNSMMIRGTMEFPDLKVSGTTLEYFAPGSCFAAITEIAGIAKFQTVFDGQKGWQEDPQRGVSEISGAELADLRRRADLRRNLKLQEYYPGLTVVGQEKLSDRSAWKLEATVEGWTYDFWSDADSGLLVRFDTDRHTAGAAVERHDRRLPAHGGCTVCVFGGAGGWTGALETEIAGREV